MARTLQSFLVRYSVMTVGIIIGSISVIFFMAPFNIAPGGVSGLAVIFNELLGTPIGFMVFLLNIPIMVLAYRMLPGDRQYHLCYCGVFGIVGCAQPAH